MSSMTGRSAPSDGAKYRLFGRPRTSMRTRSYSVLVLVACTSSCSTNNDLMRTAEATAAKYAGWTYGPDPSKHQVDCVQFLAAVLETALARPLSKDERNDVFISNIAANEQ